MVPDDIRTYIKWLRFNRKMNYFNVSKTFSCFRLFQPKKFFPHEVFFSSSLKSSSHIKGLKYEFSFQNIKNTNREKNVPMDINFTKWFCTNRNGQETHISDSFWRQFENVAACPFCKKLWSEMWLAMSLILLFFSFLTSVNWV